MAGGDADMDVGPCLFFAVLGGLATSASNNVISYVQHRCGGGGRCCNCVLVATNIVLNVAGIACFLSGARFGPVAVVMPILTASKLLSSMFFQFFMGLAKYSKEKRVGTMVLSLSALCLIEVGPTDPAEQPDALALLTTRVAEAWLLAMGLVLAGALGVYHCTGKREESSSELEMMLLSLVVAVSTALGASVGKMLSITEGAALVLSIACYLGCGVLSFVYAALAAFSCDMSVFLPTSECLQLLVNCATGLFIWGDGRRVRGKLSYAMVYSLICMGVYLCSSYDVFAHWQEREDRAPATKVGKISQSFGIVKVASSRKGFSQKSIVNSSRMMFKRQKRIVHDAFDSARDPAAVCRHFREEVVRWARLGLIGREDVESLSSMLRSAADLGTEMLQTGQIPTRDAATAPLLGRAATITVSDLPKQ